MRAAYYEHQGAASDVLRVGDIDDPQPGPGEVRVRVRVSAVNPSDTKTRQGWGQLRGMRYPRIVPHQDGAGEVDRVGAGVDPARVGERVWVYEAQHGRPFGTAAQFTVVPSANAVVLPDRASFDDGASLGVPGITAYHLLFHDGGIQGQTVLVQGGAGSVGHLAVQLARWAGARVIATAGSDDGLALARACGAHVVVNYKTQDVVNQVHEATGGVGVDRVVEVAFVRNLDMVAQLLKPSGVLSTFAIDDDPTNPPRVNLQQLAAKDITVHFALVYAMSRARHEAAIAALTAALSAGALKPRIAHRFALSQIVHAHDLLGTAGAGGKVVIDID